MKKEINVFDYASEIAKGLSGSVLLTTKADGKVNTMTIGWGTLGIEWGKPMFVTLVRKGRFTKAQLDKHAEFTINVPNAATDKKILGFCGTKSGRDVDKIKALNLTLEEPLAIDVPGIKECPLTLECKVIYKQEQDFAATSPEDLAKYYPQDVDSSYSGSNKDAHVFYHAQIVKAYIITD